MTQSLQQGVGRPTRGADEDRRVVRAVLGLVLSFAALNAFAGGAYGLAGARGVPTEWLAGSPFRDYFVPSLVLFGLVGGSLLWAALAVFAGSKSARFLAFASGTILVGWIAVQVAIIGFVSRLQPAVASTGLVVLALARTLPAAISPWPGARSFASYYLGVVRRPRATFDALMRDDRRLRLGALALFGNMALYTLVYVFLAIAHGRPTVFRPWLAIEPESYYRWNVLCFLAPSMVTSWMLAASVAQLLARVFGGKGTFEDTLSVFGFGTAVASWWTLLHDLVTAFLSAVRVIDQRAYEDAMSAPTIFRTILWLLMAGYLAAFLILFSKGVAAAHRVGRVAAALLGTAAFVTYQLVFVIFNR